MNKEEKKYYAICKKAKCSEEQTRKICQVINTEHKREAYTKKIMQEEGITVLNYSGLPGHGEQSSYEAVRSPEPMPEEVLVLKENIKILIKLVNNLPPKYKIFVAVALENDCVGVFEETHDSKYGDVDKLARILNISPRTVRRRVLATKKLLFEAGKKYF